VCESFVTIHPKTLINGIVKPSQEAFISVDERGFRFGDGLFETIPVHARIPYLWGYHMERLTAGLKALRIDCDATHLQPQALRLLEQNNITEGVLRISISRGIGSRGYLPFPATLAPTIIMQTLNRPALPKEATKLWLSAYEKISPRAMPTDCKLAQGVNAALARMEAVDHGCHEALQCSAQGHIAEASSANIFWLEEGILYTAALASGALAGVTRRRLMELSPYPVKEGLFTLDNLQKAEAVILTNAAMGILAVESLAPHGFTWTSTALATELNALRNADILNSLLQAKP